MKSRIIKLNAENTVAETSGYWSGKQFTNICSKLTVSKIFLLVYKLLS